jgi:hypothetical protein
MLEDNLLMVRRGIKDEALRFREITVGRRTRTKIVMSYLENVANPKLAQEVYQRIAKIDIDGIIDSGYVEQLISDNRWSIFPLSQATERPDKLLAGILEGRVAILVDGSSNALIVPVTVNELYQSPEDYYFGFWFGSFLRFFRILGHILKTSSDVLGKPLGTFGNLFFLAIFFSWLIIGVFGAPLTGRFVWPNLVMVHRISIPYLVLEQVGLLFLIVWLTLFLIAGSLYFTAIAGGLKQQFPKLNFQWTVIGLLVLVGAFGLLIPNGVTANWFFDLLRRWIFLPVVAYPLLVYIVALLREIREDGNSIAQS